MSFFELQTLLAHCRNRVGAARLDERGLTTTEVAVITFLLVGAAIVVMGIVYAAAKGNANNIPTPAHPGG